MSLTSLNALWKKAFTAKSSIIFLKKNEEELSKVECLKDILASMVPEISKVGMICQNLKTELDRLGEAKKILAVEKESAKEKEEKEKKPKKPKACKIPDYLVTIIVMNDRGEEVVGEHNGEEMSYSAKSMQACETIADNRMWDRADALYAEVVANKLTGKNGALVFKIDRADSIARKLKTTRGPVCQRGGGSTSKLGFGVKVKEDRCYFSRG